MLKRVGGSRLQVKVYGPGCKNCVRLIENLEQAIEQLKIEVELELVKDLNQITSDGIRRTPALAINEEVKFQGEVLTTEELKKILRDNI